jgi:hypothetical protein
VPIGKLAAPLALASAGLALTACGSAHRTTYVRVPRSAARADLVDAYDILHRAGLRVSVPPGITIASLRVPEARLSPPGGTRVARGSTVMLIPAGGPIGSPAVARNDPHYRVPDFTGRTAATAVRWAEAHGMFWELRDVPALHAGDAPHLLDAYVVTAQRPRPGGTIVQGVRAGASFRPTPLTLTVEAGT